MIQLCARVAAIEFVVAAQAIDLRERPGLTGAAPGQLGLGTGRAYRMIRELIPFTQGDGTLPADLEPLVALVTTGHLNPQPQSPDPPSSRSSTTHSGRADGASLGCGGSGQHADHRHR